MLILKVFLFFKVSKDDFFLFLRMLAAPLWRRDPFATNYLGPFGVRPREEDRVYLWPS